LLRYANEKQTVTTLILLEKSCTEKREQSAPISSQKSGQHLRHIRKVTGSADGEPIYFAPSPYLTLGLSSACCFSPLMLALVIRFAPVSTTASTFSPLVAASAVLMPS
jgi:hypothetical protein